MNRSLIACLFVAAVCFAATSKSANAQFLLNFDSTSTTDYSIDRLESVVQAKPLSHDLMTRVLTISGSPVADQVQVRLYESWMTVYYTNSMGESDKMSFKSGEVSKIVFDGHEGNDTFQIDGDEWMLRGYFRFTCELRGGDGNDWLEGGVFNDLIVGGPGRDYLFGNEGSDELYGEGDYDYLNAGPGADLLDGGCDRYADTMVGGEGHDEFTVHVRTYWYKLTTQYEYEWEYIVDHSAYGQRDAYKFVY